jgi:23S rRNA G2445 N2-methylase RlmL
MASNSAPGLNRKFALNSWQNIDQGLFKQAIQEAKNLQNICISEFKVAGL